MSPHFLAPLTYFYYFFSTSQKHDNIRQPLRKIWYLPYLPGYSHYITIIVIIIIIIIIIVNVIIIRVIIIIIIMIVAAIVIKQNVKLSTEHLFVCQINEESFNL